LKKRQGSGSYITGHFQDRSQNVIAVLVNSENDYFYPSLLSDIQTFLSRHNFIPRIYVTGNDTFTERGILTDLLEAPPRVLLVEGCKSALPNPNLDLYENLKKKGVRFVFLHNQYPSFPDCTCIKDDNIGGSLLLVQELIKSGHTAIGGFFKSDDAQGIERYQGFMEAMRNALLPVPDHRIGWFNTGDLKNLRQQFDTDFLKKLAQNHLKDCTAVICYNNEIAYELAKELKKMSFSVPDDIMIASFDNTYLATYHDTAFLTIAHSLHEPGYPAAEAILNELKGIHTPSLELAWQVKGL
jgi:GntR family transcriptional regulator of arabinose operon